MTKFNWNNKRSHTSIKDETTQRQHDQAAEWLYCRDQESPKKKTKSAYIHTDSGMVHVSKRHRESKQHRRQREQRLQQQKQRFEAEMLLYEEQRRRFDMSQQGENGEK